MVARLALDAMVWTGEGSPTLAERSKRLPEFQSKNRRPIDRAFVRSIFDRDHPGTADDDVIEAFADAILKLDDSVPTGTYVDMCAQPAGRATRRRSRRATIIMRGEYDGIASFDDLREVLREAAESGQAVRRDARHRARLACSRRTTCSSITSC